MKNATTKKRDSELDRFIKTHRSTCAVHVFSGSRKCSCGRDTAHRDVNKMRRRLQVLINIVMETSK